MFGNEFKCNSFGSFLNDFVYSFPGTAHLKDIKSFKYLLANTHELNIYNFQAENELLGQTVFELEQLMGKKWPKNFAQEIYENDKNIEKRMETTVMNKIIFLTGNGYLSVRRLMKTPVFGVHGKITGILTLGFELTSSLAMNELWELYKNLYQYDFDITTKFINHIGLHDWVISPLTIREIDCILAMHKNKTTKSVAKALLISTRTVESHVENIKTKIKFGDLNRVIENMTVLPQNIK